MTVADGAITSEWRRGWPVVLAALLGVSLSTIHIYGTGLFFEPLQKEFGWSRAEISSAMILPSIAGFLLSPFIGGLIDRVGARRIAIPGTIFYCAMVASLSLTGHSIWSWWALWTLLGLSLALLPATVWSKAVASYFTRGRGLALAIALCGTGLGASLVPPITNLLIDRLGWRGAFVGLGAIWAVIVLPVALLFFYEARDRDRQAARLAGTPLAAALAQAGLTVRQGFRSRQFYQLAFAALAGTTAIVGFVVHLVPMLAATGIARGDAAKLAGLVGIPSIVGRLLVGYLFDRANGSLVGGIAISLPAVTAIILLAFPGSTSALIAAIIVLGFAVGGEYDGIIYLATRHLGLRSFGTLFGCIFAMIVLSVGIGPLLAARIFDVTGSYHWYLAAVIPISSTAGLLLATLGRYPEFAPSPAEATP